MTNRIRLKKSLPVSFRISIQSMHVSAENDSVLVRRAHQFALLEKKGEIFEVDRRSVPARLRLDRVAGLAACSLAPRVWLAEVFKPQPRPR